jgi:predicted ATPase/DNA-binding SARP family transcriptional activator
MSAMTGQNTVARAAACGRLSQATWRIDMLGRLVAHPRNGEDVQSGYKRFSRSKTGALLGWLCYHIEQDHPREMLADRLWPDSGSDTAKHNLNQALYKLRQEFGEPDLRPQNLVLSNHLHVRLNSDLIITDVQTFRALLCRVNELGTLVDLTESRGERIDLLSQAVDLYRGALLPGYYDEWVLIERERLALQFVDSVVSLLQLLSGSKEFERALQVGLKAASTIPCHEELSIAVMGLYQNLGKPIDGLREYVRMRTALRRYEGRDPGPTSSALAVALKRQALSLGLRPPRPQVRRSAGSAERTTRRARGTQPLASEAPLSDTAPATASHFSVAKHDEGRLSQLPQWRSKFIGRDSELDRLVRMLRYTLEADRSQYGDAAWSEDRRRLITVLGIAGTGKSRLVVEAASRLSTTFSGGTAYVPLAECRDPRLVADHLGVALELHRSQVPASVQSIARAMGERPLLLILDNVEHLLPTAAGFLQELLSASPGLVCLCTSRLPLGLEAEQLLPLAPLATVRPEAPLASIGAAPAVQLFVDRARLVRPDFQLSDRNGAAVAALCRRLDGIPLAIELAAARSNVLTPLQMLERMADRFGLLVAQRGRAQERHQSLRDAVAWSYELLCTEVKETFIQLSVFSGGWTIEAAEAVCATSPMPCGVSDLSGSPEPVAPLETVVLDRLQHLVERSMVQFTEVGGVGRYSMLQTLSDFAAELRGPVLGTWSGSTVQSLRARAAERHAQFYGDVAISEERSLRGGVATQRHIRLSLEDENLDSALEWMRVSGNNGRLLAVAAALWRYWYWHGSTQKGGRWLQESLSDQEGIFGIPIEDADTLAWTKACLGLGALARLDGDYSRSRSELDRAASGCAALRARGATRGLDSLHGDICQQWAILHEEQGDTAAAIGWQQEALSQFLLLDDTWGVATSQGNLGRISQKAGVLREARRCYELALTSYDGLGDVLQCAAVWNNIGSVAYEMEDYLGAKLAFETSCAMFAEFGNRRAMAMPTCNLGDTLVQIGAFDEARPVLADGLDALRQAGDEIGQGYVLISLGTIETRQGDHARGLCLLTAGRSVLSRRNAPLSVGCQAGLERDLSTCQDHLTESEGVAAAAFGNSLTLNSAIHLALSR